MVLLLVTEHRIAVLPCADGPGVDHVADKDTAVSDLTRRRRLEDHLDGRIDELVTAHDGQRHALDHVRGILDATVDALLAALADAVHVVILEPVDVRGKQGLFDLLEFRLADDGFNLFHTLLLLFQVGLVSNRVYNPLTSEHKEFASN